MFRTLVYFVSFRCIHFLSFRIIVNSVSLRLVSHFSIFRFVAFRFAFQYISFRCVSFLTLVYFVALRSISFRFVRCVSISFRSLVQPRINVHALDYFI